MWESLIWEFRHLGVPGQKTIWMWPSWRGTKYTIRGKVVASAKSGPWWILWVRVCSWLILAPKVVQLCINHLVLVFCKSMWVVEACQFFLVPSRSSSMPFYPSKVLWVRECASTPCFFVVFYLGLTFESFKELGTCQFLVWTLYKQGVWSSSFTLKNVYTWDEPFKRLNLKQKIILCTIWNYLPPEPTYLLKWIGN